MKKRWYEFMLWIAYFFMIGVCIFLNLTTGFKEDLANIIVNVVMFIIVGIVFIWADGGCFAKVNTIIKDLNEATTKIKSDALNSHAFLWEPYKAGNVELFKSKELTGVFRDFAFEINRKSDSENVYYRPSIDDYINDELIDTTIHRNELNQVAGMLTGLGILGTFIGLSLGLQNFNTGTTQEMANSIEPLMNGIKVAFHTSIYGMVFSLVFNLVYKRKLYDADVAVDSFTIAFRKYVLPDATNDGMNRLIDFQREQLGAFEEMSVRIGRELSNIITPQFDRLNDTIVSFERMATKEQSEAMGLIVENFIAEMNRSLSGSFAQIIKMVDDDYQLQKNNATMMQDIMSAANQNFGNLNAVNAEAERLISTLNTYSGSINSIQTEIKATVDRVCVENSDMLEFLHKEQAVLAKQEKMIYEFKNSIDSLNVCAMDSNDQITDAVDYLRKAIDRLDANILNRGFRRGK